MKFKLSILALACSSMFAQAQLMDSTQSAGYNISGSLAPINANIAFTRGLTGAGSTIAILDSGVNLSSSAFTGRIVGEQDFSGSGNMQDHNGHGQFVAGEAAGQLFDSAGNLKLQGVAPGANLLIGKITDSSLSFDINIINALAWAGSKGATVANLSSSMDNINYTTTKVADGIYTVVGMTNNPTYWQKVTAEDPNKFVNAMNTNPNMVLVVAAGNTGKFYSAGYSELAVATNPNGSLMFGGRIIVAGNLYMSSNFDMLAPTSAAAGTICMTFTNGVCQDQYKISQFYLMAPGTNITGLSNTNDVNTVKMSGTSMSAPIISGAVAIIAQEWPKMTGANIVQLLLQTANKNIPYYKPFINGQGVLDLAAATSPVGLITIPTNGPAVNTQVSPILITGGSASLSKLASVMMIDSYQRDFYAKGASLQYRMPVNEFNASQSALPYQTHNPYTQFNTFSDYFTVKSGNLEFTAYRDTSRPLAQDQSFMAEMSLIKDNFKFTAGAFTEQNTWLGNYTNSINVNSQSLTSFIGVNYTKKYNDSEIYATFHNGLTNSNAHGDYISSVGPVLSYSWSLGAETHLDKKNSLGFMVYQPVAVYRAMASTNIPTGFDSAGNIMYTNSINLAAGVKEVRAGGYWKFSDKNNSHTLAFLETRQNYQGVQGLSETAVGLSVNYKF